MERPVAWQSCFFSSSEGYGWSLCLCSQSLRKSVTGLGSFPRLRCGGRSTREGLEDGTAWGERLGELVTLMDGFAPALAARLASSQTSCARSPVACSVHVAATSATASAALLPLWPAG